MSHMRFQVGQKCENMKGIYEVLAVDGNAMRIRWQDGEEMTTTVALQSRIIERMQRERKEVEAKGPTKRRKAKTAAKKTTVKESASKEPPAKSVGIKREYLRGQNVCRVTFSLPRIAAGDAKSVCIVGDFNNWNVRNDPMEKQENQDYTITLDLKPGKEYQFRYLIDQSKWVNDWNADKYVKSPYTDSDNSVVVV